MAMNLCSESPGLVISPRISFSHNLCQADTSPIENNRLLHRLDSNLLESSCDFDFCITESFKQEESCSADELFSDGKLLPLQIREKLFSPKPELQFPFPRLPQHDLSLPIPPPHHHQPGLPPVAPPPTVNVVEESKKESLKEAIAMGTSESTEKASPKSSFWRFRRSASLGNGHKRSLICSLPLLSRSNSTGSAPNPKLQRPPLSKDNQKNLQKNATVPSSKLGHSHSSQRPPLRKNYGSYNNGVRISPVLNVPPPYISKGTASLFGLGSFFSKDKNKKK